LANTYATKMMLMMTAIMIMTKTMPAEQGLFSEPDNNSPHFHTRNTYTF
jgi:hypothetical protein